MNRNGIKGGQGRSPQSVEDDGNALAIGLVTLASLGIWWLIYRMLS